MLLVIPVGACRSQRSKHAHSRPTHRRFWLPRLGTPSFVNVASIRLCDCEGRMAEFNPPKRPHHDFEPRLIIVYRVATMIVQNVLGWSKHEKTCRLRVCGWVNIRLKQNIRSLHIILWRRLVAGQANDARRHNCTCIGTCPPPPPPPLPAADRYRAMRAPPFSFMIIARFAGTEPFFFFARACLSRNWWVSMRLLGTVTPKGRGQSHFDKVKSK